MKWFNLVTLLCVCTTGVLSAEKLRLEDALRLGKENSRILKISAADRDAEEAKSTEARSELYPSIGLFGAYTRIEEGKFRLTTTNQPQAIAVGDVVADNYVFRIGLRQPLFTGFRTSSEVDAADASAEAAQLDFSMSEANLVYNITAAYWFLFQARESETFTRENVRRLESDRDDTKRLLDAGSATQNDLLRVEVQLSNAKISEIEARNDGALARMNLNDIIGLPVETEIDLLSAPETNQSPGTAQLGEADVRDLVKRAEDTRPDLKAASARVEAAASRVSAAEGGWWPQIDLTANYIYNNPNSRYQPITPDFLGTWDVGVSAALDLWSGGGTVSRVDEAQTTLVQARLREEQLKASVEIEIYRAKLDLARSEEKLSVALLVASQAEEQLRVTTEKYRVGLATSTELLDAEVSLLQTQTQSSAARVGLALAQALLSRALGETAEARAKQMSDVVIDVKELSRSFGSFVAVDRISFQVRRGEIFGFLGANGAGKSTTIRMLCGLLQPTSGNATVGGYDVDTETENVKRSIGYMSQRFSLYDDLTVEQNIRFFGGVYGLQNRELEARMQWVIGTAGLGGRQHHPTGTLSGGLKQRLALGCAILHQPQIVFLDEPTGGVDPISRRNFWELIGQLSSQGVTVMVTTHFLDEAEYCNTIILINQGKLIANGTPTDLKTRYVTHPILELTTDRTVPALETIRDQPWAIETSVFGTRLHVMVSNEEEGKKQIAQLLSGKQIAFNRLERIVPSLEDVFLWLLEQPDRKST